MVYFSSILCPSAPFNFSAQWKRRNTYIILYYIIRNPLIFWHYDGGLGDFLLTSRTCLRTFLYLLTHFAPYSYFSGLQVYIDVNLLSIMCFSYVGCMFSVVLPQYSNGKRWLIIGRWFTVLRPPILSCACIFKVLKCRYHITKPPAACSEGYTLIYYFCHICET